MSLPVPRLDDRGFQDLVDEAKRRISDRCPEWTDHNVSDPGVTLIELFAHMVDETIYRLNRVPEKLQLLLMDLVGMRLRPATSALTRLTFWLAAPPRFWAATQEDAPLLAPAGVEVATARSGTEIPISFRTAEDLHVVRASVVALHLGDARDDDVDPRPVHRRPGSAQVPVFGQDAPVVGAAFFLELARPLPGCAVKLDLECDPNRGFGIVPESPPWRWTAWCDDGWRPCEVDRDTTGGLNRSGSVYLHVPARHAERAFPGTSSAAWLRCALTEPAPGEPFYDSSPAVGSVVGLTLGGTVDARQADLLVRDEVVGVSDGTYGQPAFALRHTPVTAASRPGEPLLFAGDDPVPWTAVTGFERSDATSRHYVLDRVGGVLRLGVAVRQPDERVRHYGAVPPAGAPLRIAEYSVGGGTAGNVRATALRVLKSPVPAVRAVENRHAATGGTDAETLDQALLRAPVFLQQRTRAVTLDDFAWLAREATTHVARAHAVPGGERPEDALSVRVVVVPALPDGLGLDSPLGRELTELPETMTAVAQYLDERRLVGTRVLVTPPRYVPVRVVARVLLDPRTRGGDVVRRAHRALYRALHPLVGGPDGSGWPFGEDVRLPELRAALLAVDGVVRVDSLRLLDEHEQEQDVVEVPEAGLPVSAQHTVEVA